VAGEGFRRVGLLDALGPGRFTTCRAGGAGEASGHGGAGGGASSAAIRSRRTGPAACLTHVA
jgi:hypothetical protein